MTIFHVSLVVVTGLLGRYLLVFSLDLRSQESFLLNPPKYLLVHPLPIPLWCFSHRSHPLQTRSISSGTYVWFGSTAFGFLCRLAWVEGLVTLS